MHKPFVTDVEVPKAFRVFETRNREVILTRLIAALGMDPNYVSEAAKVATEKGESLLKTMTDGLFREVRRNQRDREHYPGGNERSRRLGIAG